MLNPNKTLSVTVMSGKGGVGKTNIALNLAYALHAAGSRIMLMDCDLGLANLDVLLGISPERNMQDLLRPDVSSSEVVVKLEDGGLDLLPAASGVPELVEMDEDMQSILFKKLVQLISRYQYLVLDLGAGISQTVLSLAAMTRFRVVVMTPEPTSLTDSYALMKVLKAQHGVTDFHVVVNDVSSMAEAKQAFERLSAACHKFLNIDLIQLGVVPHDATVTEAVRRQTPVHEVFPQLQGGKKHFEYFKKNTTIPYG